MAGGDAMNYDAFTIKSKFECNSTNYISEQCNNKSTNETSAYVGLLDDDTTKCQEDLIDDYHLNLESLDTNRSQSSSSLSASSKESRKIHYINSAIFIERDDSTSNLCYDSELDDNNHAKNNTYRTNNRQQCMKNRCLKLILQNEDSKVTIKSLTPSDASTNENTKRSRCMTFKQWLAHKQQIKQKQRKMVDSKEKQREQGEEKQRVEEQREDFKRWLAIKKEQEIRKKKEAELRALKIRQENEMRAQKMAEKEEMFKVWTRRKAEEAKEKKRQEEEQLRQIEEIERERKEKSAKAFEEWAKKSKYNPRPVPLNMGVESLKGSVSAMFVNPTPWKENTDIRQTTSA